MDRHCTMNDLRTVIGSLRFELKFVDNVRLRTASQCDDMEDVPIRRRNRLLRQTSKGH